MRYNRKEVVLGNGLLYRERLSFQSMREEVMSFLVGMSLDRQTASLLFAVALVGVPLSVEKEVPGQFFYGAVLLGRGAGRK